MPYIVRPMCRDDITQVTAIDREAFPTMWPPMNYHREMDNILARYLVVTESSLDMNIEGNQREGGLRRMSEWLRPGRTTRDKIVGFAGFWMMAAEAHIISLAVKAEHRRKGLGQLLLLALIEDAINRESAIVTLEVRVSNYEAQRLYLKHGFVEKGVRRAYYTDNREDALIMTLEDAATPECCRRVAEAREGLHLEV